MDWIYAHLVVNHFPIVLAVLASSAAAIAALSGREGVWRYAAVTGLLAGIAAPIAFLTGNRAEEIAEQLPGIAEEAIETHEHWGLYALIALGIAGVLAILALITRSRGARWLFAIGIWVATAVVTMTANYGGKIEHDPAERAGTLD
jgi:uncharacterized membrane protein